jgi:resuscitation-promoting factor RpfA
MRAGVRRALVGGAIMLGLFGGVAGSASAAPVAKGGAVLERIAQCESGNRNVPNSWGGSSAQGYWQIISATWKGHGGRQFAATPMGASRAEQRIVAERILARQGLGAWRSSARCWAR